MRAVFVFCSSRPLPLCRAILARTVRMASDRPLMVTSHFGPLVGSGPKLERESFALTLVLVVHRL